MKFPLWLIPILVVALMWLWSWAMCKAAALGDRGRQDG
jgi:hypothetical protein